MTEMNRKPHVILGLLTFGPDPPASVTSLSEFNAILDIYQLRGYHEVDTARSYNGGRQESFTREAGWKERGLTLATKLFPDPSKTSQDKHINDIRQQFGTSLRELGTDFVDILYLHAPSRDVHFLITLAAINTLFEEGKFRRLGLSNYAAFEVAEIVMLCQQHNWVRPTVYQGTYNALARNVEDELLPCLKRYGIAFYAYSPLAGGLLTNRYLESTSTPTEGRFSEASGKLGEGYRAMWFRKGNLKVLRPIYEEAQKASLNMLQVALRWMVHHSPLRIANNGGDGIVVGASSREQLEENLDALAQGPLSEEMLGFLDEAWKMVKADANPYWAGKLEYGTGAQEVLVSKP